MNRYPDVEVNSGPRAGVPAGRRIMFANINGPQRILDELSVAASHFDIVFCCETKVTRRRHAAALRLPGYFETLLLPRGSRPNRLGMVMYSRSGLAVSRLSMFDNLWLFEYVRLD